MRGLFRNAVLFFGFLPERHTLHPLPLQRRVDDYTDGLLQVLEALNLARHPEPASHYAAGQESFRLKLHNSDGGPGGAGLWFVAAEEFACGPVRYFVVSD